MKRPSIQAPMAHRQIARHVRTSVAGERSQPRPLTDWRDAAAYVLLGDPGAGKSAALRSEADATGGAFFSARDFVALTIPAEDAGKTLFIDGLDEMRAGRPGAVVALDAIRTKLDALGRPRFRLSCREYDWRSQSDLEDLGRVAPGGELEELHLEPLTHAEQHQILVARQAEVGDAEAFLRRAERDGLVALFGNPLLLDLTIRATAVQGQWPGSRRAVYDLACRKLATEHSQRHRDAKPLQPGDVDRLLDDAGLLCALLLLSGQSALSMTPEERASVVPWHTLPSQLALHDAAGALASKIFVTTADESRPLHRSIAEYLAGQAIARRVQDGQLPLGRVLALMQGGDGRVVEPLRGLLGWLATHDARDRAELVHLDPLAVVLNGDAAAFSVTDKRALLQGLQNEAQRNPWFRQQQWVSHPFAPLAAADMSDALVEVLADHAPEPEHQALVDCVLDALQHGAAVEALRKPLEAWVEDAEAWFANRLQALQVWARCLPLDVGKARLWLDRLWQGELQDLDARLAGQLLSLLYPNYLGPKDVLRYWPRSGDVGVNSVDPKFWYRGLIDQSRPADFPVLADAWIELQPQQRRLHRDGERKRLLSKILANALTVSGDEITDERLYAWLGIGIDTNGFSKLDSISGGEVVAQWLTERPTRAKAVVTIGWRRTQPDVKSGRRYFWESEQRLHRAQRPRDWLHWLLEEAAAAPNDELAQYCFSQVAHAAVEPPPGLDLPSMAEVEEWVVTHGPRWPQAAQWLQDSWSSKLQGNWQADQHYSQRKDAAQALASRTARNSYISPWLAALIDGTAPPQLMHQLAGAHEDRFHDIQGETPAQRVQDWMGCSIETAHTAIAGLRNVLTRYDLPTVDEIFALDAAGKFHYLRSPALLAARLAYEGDPTLIHRWPDQMLACLVAFWLTEGIGELPDWYKAAVEWRAELVAPLLVRHALPRLRRRGPLNVTGLWALSDEPGHAALARLVLPPLLRGFPHRASEQSQRELNRSLLAAIHLLEAEDAAAIVRNKLDETSINAAQRISWMVAALPYLHDVPRMLVELVGKNQRRAVMLGIALHEQGSLSRVLGRVPAPTVAQLVELLAPITKPDLKLGAYWVGPAEERRDTVRALIDMLAANPDSQAADMLQRLLRQPQLQPWEAHLRHSVLSQQAVSREVHYVHPSVEAVALTLAKGAPANQADLLALTLDHLHDIERHLRASDTFELLQFWERSEPAGRVPRWENECRQLLLVQLRRRLISLGINVVPERLAANDKRADLRVEYSAAGLQLAVPIEIKREDNRGLWLAWRDQLQSLYSIDPAASEHGIYLVLWFGQKPRSSPEGLRPVSATELQRQLTARIPRQDRVRLVAKVLDLSLPA